MKPRNMAQALGRRGGQARARRLPAAERSRIAALGGHARRRAFETARRILDNLRYADALRDLQPQSPRVKRVKTCSGPLPGLYRPRR